MRQLSDDALADLKRWEGCVLYSYDDADPASPKRFVRSSAGLRGTLTIGYGHTTAVMPGQRIDQATAETLLRADLEPVEAAVERCIRVPLTDGQFGALVSFAFNLGHATTPDSPLSNIAATLNKADYAGAIQRMQRYTKKREAGKLVDDDGLVNRRAAEAGLWARGTYVASASQPATTGTSTAREVITSTGTGRAAIGVGLAGILGVIAQSGPVLAALGSLAPVVSITLVLVTAAVFVLWRKGQL